MKRYSYYIIICMLNPCLLVAQDYPLISGKSTAGFRSIRSISNSIVRATDEPLSMRRLSREDLTGLSPEIHSQELNITREQSKAINQKRTLKCVKTETGFTVIDLATNRPIKESTVEGNFDMQWEEDSETVRIITCTTLFRFRMAHESLLCRLNSDQLGFLKYCSTIWEKQEPVIIQGPKRHRAYTGLPAELRHTSLFTVIPELHEQNESKTLLSSAIALLLNLFDCRS